MTIQPDERSEFLQCGLCFRTVDGMSVYRSRCMDHAPEATA